MSYSMPGAFPGGFSGSNHEEANSSNGSTHDTSAAISINNRRVCKKRKTMYANELFEQINTLGYLLIFIIYIYDCNFLILLLKVWSQLLNSMHVPSELMERSRSILYFTIIANFSTILIHIFMAPTKANPYDNGFVYGHLTVNFIGQEALTSNNYLIVLDVIVLFINFLLHQLSYNQTDNSVETTLNDSNQDIDGYQGEIMVKQIRFSELFQVKQPSLLDSPNNSGYGSINSISV